MLHIDSPLVQAKLREVLRRTENMLKTVDKVQATLEKWELRLEEQEHQKQHRLKIEVEMRVRDEILVDVRALFVAGSTYNNGYEFFLDGIVNLFEEELSNPLVVSNNGVLVECWMTVLAAGKLSTHKVFAEITMPKLLEEVEVISLPTDLFVQFLHYQYHAMEIWPTGIGIGFLVCVMDFYYATNNGSSLLSYCFTVPLNLNFSRCTEMGRYEMVLALYFIDMLVMVAQRSQRMVVRGGFHKYIVLDLYGFSWLSGSNTTSIPIFITIYVENLVGLNHALRYSLITKLYMAGIGIVFYTASWIGDDKVGVSALHQRIMAGNNEWPRTINHWWTWSLMLICPFELQG